MPTFAIVDSHQQPIGQISAPDYIAAMMQVCDRPAVKEALAAGGYTLIGKNDDTSPDLALAEYHRQHEATTGDTEPAGQPATPARARGARRAQGVTIKDKTTKPASDDQADATEPGAELRRLHEQVYPEKHEGKPADTGPKFTKNQVVNLPMGKGTGKVSVTRRQFVFVIPDGTNSPLKFTKEELAAAQA